MSLDFGMVQIDYYIDNGVITLSAMEIHHEFHF